MPVVASFRWLPHLFIFTIRKIFLFNVVLAATAEEEISGSNGIEALLSQLPRVDAGIVGEPTLMNMAVAKRVAGD